jgi:hypothetical protein
MRDALKLVSNQPVVIDGVKHKLDSIYYMESRKQVYIKVLNTQTRVFVNITVEEFITHLSHGNK